MYRFRDTSLAARARLLSRLWLILGIVLAIPSLILMTIPAEISVLVQPDGNMSWFFNRQFDLPTDDPRELYECSLRPLFWCFFGCSLFYFVIHGLALRAAP